MSTATPVRIHFTQADFLKKAREIAGLTQQQIADRIGIDRASVIAYEKRGTKKEYILREWADVTGVAREDLAPRREDQPSD
ncbi:helix-turn-helix protein [Microcella alkaliphila]|uniref:Helix-turn-helix protein n=1 Tax=Microcella alkaliphila TaxID=279828 RepID=A0A4Q7TI55_9MICO|nr:helix-turn-helix transcriptional regulator [Microcella alkaliphila]RZT59360.1 helix-turn-helix protein [Microcella alkaliphila]